MLIALRFAVRILWHRAPLGSPLPLQCPSSGFYCPGAAADSVTGGSLPLELAQGSASREALTGAVQYTVTLDATIDDYNATAVRLALAALYGIFDEHIHLSVEPGSLLLTVLIEASRPLSLSSILSNVRVVDSDTLETILRGAFRTNVSVVASTVPHQTNISGVVDFVVGPGKWTTAGRIIDCPVGAQPTVSTRESCLPRP